MAPNSRTASRTTTSRSGSSVNGDADNEDNTANAEREVKLPRICDEDCEYKRGKCCAKKLQDKLCDSSELIRSLQDVNESARARLYAANLQTNCRARDYSFSILGSIFTRQQKNPCMFADDKVNAFAVSIKSWAPFDTYFLPFVIFKDVQTGATHAFPYLEYTVGAMSSQQNTPGFNLAQALQAGGLFRIKGNASNYNTLSTPQNRTDLCVPAVGVIVGSNNFFNAGCFPNGNYIVSIACLGWSFVTATNSAAYPSSGFAQYQCPPPTTPVTADQVDVTFLGWIMSATCPTICTMDDSDNCGLISKLPWNLLQHHANCSGTTSAFGNPFAGFGEMAAQAGMDPSLFASFAGFQQPAGLLPVSIRDLIHKQATSALKSQFNLPL